MNTPYSVLTEIIPFLYLQGSLLGIGILLYRRCRQWFEKRDAFLATAVLLISWITFLQMGLGLLHLLSPLSLMIVQTLVWMGLFWANRKYTILPSPIQDASSRSSPQFLEQFLFILFLVYLGSLYWRIPFAFPYRVDTMVYHLPFVVHWMQTHSLAIPSFLLDGGEQGYPAGQELLVHWFVSPLRSDLFAALPNMAMLGLLGIGMVSLSEKLGISRWSTWLAVLLVLTCPLMEWLSQTLYVEIAYVFFLVCATNFGILAIKNSHTPGFLCFCPAFGLAAGVKSTHVAYGVLLLGFLLGGTINERKVAWKKVFSARNVGIFLVLVFLLAGFWYSRNLVWFGNPIYPFSPGLLLNTLSGTAEGYSLEESHSLMSHIGEASSMKLWLAALNRRVGGWSWILLIITLLVPVIHGVSMLRNKVQPDRKNQLIRFALALLVLGYLFLYLITPWQIQLELQGMARLGFVSQAIRYGLPWLVLGALLLASLTNRLPGQLLLLACTGFTLVGGLYRTISQPLFLIPGQDRFLYRWNLVIALAIAFLLTLGWRNRTLKSLVKSRIARVVLGCGLALGIGYIFSGYHDKSRSQRQDDRYRKVLLHISMEDCRKIRQMPENSKMFFWRCLAPYVFYGQHLDHKIHPFSSRKENTSIQEIPWSQLKDDPPDVIYIGRGTEGIPDHLKDMPVDFLENYMIREYDGNCLLMMRKRELSLTR